MIGRLDMAPFLLMIIIAAVPNFPQPPFGVGFWDVGVYFGDAGGPQCPPPPLESPTHRGVPDMPPLVMDRST